MATVVASPRMREILETARRVARTNATVLIQGESGCGKELIARAIHCYSLRCARNWIDVNCAALPEHLVESELFGYERGAFSGAQTAKPGLFELADRGSLFLDEIGELDRRVQVKLLRVLDNVPYYRLGGTRKMSVDVRVIAATNRDLRQMTIQGEFRSDLFYRLSAVSISVPPLRERTADIGPLADYFVAQTNPQALLTSSARERLLLHHWPGNVRELRNVILRALAIAPGREVWAEHLGLDEPIESRIASGPSTHLEDLERTAVLQMLQRTNGHQQRAAAALGISRRTLTRRLQAYGVSSRRSA